MEVDLELAACTLLVGERPFIGVRGRGSFGSHGAGG